MAGDWIKMEAATPDKPEVLAIAARMGWDDPDTAVGKLFRVWRWFDQHTTNGNAAGVTSALLDRIAGVTGFADAMRAVGWLIVTEAGIELPNFDRHCGKTAKDRAQTAKRVAEHKSNAKANAKGNAKGNAASVTGALPREEKRREEEKTKDGAGAPAPDPIKDLFDRGVAVLGGERSGRAFLGKLRKQFGDVVVAQAVTRCEAQRPSDPVPWMVKACETIGAKAAESGSAPSVVPDYDPLASAQQRKFAGAA
jgi:chorismate mutase